MVCVQRALYAHNVVLCFMMQHRTQCISCVSTAQSTSPLGTLFGTSTQPLGNYTQLVYTLLEEAVILPLIDAVVVGAGAPGPSPRWTI